MGLKGQFKQADRLNSKFLIILNDEDLAHDEVKIKNNKTKEEELVGIFDRNEEYEESNFVCFTLNNEACYMGGEKLSGCYHDICYRS